MNNCIRTMLTFFYSQLFTIKYHVWLCLDFLPLQLQFVVQNIFKVEDRHMTIVSWSVNDGQLRDLRLISHLARVIN